MTWLRRLLGMGEPAAPPHVQEAMDAGAAADKAFAEVHEAVDEYRRARDRQARRITAVDARIDAQRAARK